MAIANWLRIFGISRVAFGAWLAAAPGKPGEMWFGSREHPASTVALLRSVGARDVGLGLGLASDPRPDSAWLLAGIMADVGDAVGALLIRDRVPTKNFLTGLIGASVYTLIGGAIALRNFSKS